MRISFCKGVKTILDYANKPIALLSILFYEDFFLQAPRKDELINLAVMGVGALSILFYEDFFLQDLCK